MTPEERAEKVDLALVYCESGFRHDASDAGRKIIAAAIRAAVGQCCEEHDRQLPGLLQGAADRAYVKALEWAAKRCHAQRGLSAVAGLLADEFDTEIARRKGVK